MSLDTASSPAIPHRRPILAAGVVVAILCVVVAVTLLFRIHSQRPAHDQAEYFWPTIQQFSSQWPRPDLSDYKAAMTPGYFLIMVLPDRALDHNVLGVRAVGSIFGLTLMALLGRSLGKRLPWQATVALLLPLTLSPYIFGSTAWLLPDNAGWIGVAGAFVACIFCRSSRGLPWLAMLTAFWAVAVRQSHVWVMLPLFIAAVLPDTESQATIEIGAVTANRQKNMILVLLGLLPAAGLLLAFILLWRGLVPPSANAWNHTGINPAAPTMLLAITGIFGLFYVPWMPRSCRPVSGAMAIGLMVGILTAILPVTTYSWQEGRGTGIWNLVPNFPLIADRSVLFMILSPIGGLIIARWLVAMNRLDAIAFLSLWIGFAAAQTATVLAWQRYLEPFVLMAFPFMAARTSTTDNPSLVKLLLPVGLGIVQLAVLIAAFR